MINMLHVSVWYRKPDLARFPKNGQIPDLPKLKSGATVVKPAFIRTMADNQLCNISLHCCHIHHFVFFVQKSIATNIISK